MPGATREEFEKRAGTARLYDGVLFVGLAAVLSLPGQDDIFLASAGRQGPGVFSPYAKEQYLGNVSEIEPHPSSVGSAVLPDLVPITALKVGLGRIAWAVLVGSGE